MTTADTRFDLETRIRNWKASLLAHDGVDPEVADELEDHLRESFAELQGQPSGAASRLDAEEAFLVAARRIGGVDLLADEFERVTPDSAWRRRWIWLLCGYVGGHFVFQVVLNLATVSYALTHRSRPLLGALLYVGVFLAGLAAVIHAARSRSLRSRFGRFAEGLAPHLGRKVGLVAFLALALLLSALVTPIGAWVVSSTEGESASSFALGGTGGEAWIIQGSRILVWAAPFFALALLLRPERTGRQTNSTPDRTAS